MLKLYKSENQSKGKPASKIGTITIGKSKDGKIRGSINGKGSEFTNRWTSFIIALDEGSNSHYLLAQKTTESPRIGYTLSLPETTPIRGCFELSGITAKVRKELGANDTDFPLVLKLEKQV